MKVFKAVLLFLLFLSESFSKDDWNAPDYASNSFSQESSASEFLQDFHFQGNETIMDVGCGDGKITFSLAEKVPKGFVLGVDLSASMIDLARKQYLDKVTNIDFEMKDAANLDYSQKFDMITSFTVMQWVLDQKGALECFYKSLKPQGRLLIQMPMGLPEEMASAMQKVISKNEWKEYFRGFSPPWKFYTPAEYRDLLVDSGFTPKRLKVAKKEEIFLSRETFQSFIKQWFPYLRPLSSDLKDRFLSQLLDVYLEILPPLSGGQIIFSVKSLEVEAEKGEKRPLLYR